MSLHDHHSSPKNCGPNGLLDVLAHPPEGDGRERHRYSATMGMPDSEGRATGEGLHMTHQSFSFSK